MTVFNNQELLFYSRGASLLLGSPADAGPGNEAKGRGFDPREPGAERPSPGGSGGTPAPTGIWRSLCADGLKGIETHCHWVTATGSEVA